MSEDASEDVLDKELHRILGERLAAYHYMASFYTARLTATKHQKRPFSSHVCLFACWESLFVILASVRNSV